MTAMFQGWRFKLREAEEALQSGQLDEASRLVSDAELGQYLPGKRLAQRVAGQLADRARRRVIAGETDAGWNDLRSAGMVGGDSPAVLEARHELTEMGVTAVGDLLRGGDVSGAITRLESLEKEGIHDESVRAMKQFARCLHSAQHLARRGKFVDAEAQLNSAESLEIKFDGHIIEQRRNEYRDKRLQSRQLTEDMHRALINGHFTEAVTLADQILEIAPENRLAKDARRRAWAEAGARVDDSCRLGDTQVWRPSAEARIVTSSADPKNDDHQRFVLWVDAVGGFLVCLENELMLGQAVPGNHVDIPIQADISRQHAKIRRLGDGYVIDPLQSVTVAGQPIHDTTLLSDGDEIELGNCVRMRFRQPHALSASARLDFVSRHRTLPTADSVLLMAESCVLGPRWQNHVVCRDWAGDVVLYRHEDQLYCRAMDAIEIDGQLCDGRGQVTPNSHVSGSDFSMSLEQVK